jgi:hypothetical protein
MSSQIEKRNRPASLWYFDARRKVFRSRVVQPHLAMLNHVCQQERGE